MTAGTRIALLCLFAGAVARIAPADGDRAPFSARERDHWAWRAPVRPAVPCVRFSAWVKNPIDAFILARLESERRQPASPASREQLMRRVTFDLTGLPPTPEEIDAFVADRSSQAWEKVIDRLLASPHYGERWGRHWLDLVRYADSNGFEHDEVRPDAWRYRDYVIQSFNHDNPFDRFIAEQIAGDELYPEDRQALIATGFQLLGPDMTDASDMKQRRQHTLNDITDTSALVFTGITLACARCHDHKFEPLTRGDYYRFQSFFSQAVFRFDIAISTEEERRANARATERYRAQVLPIDRSIRQLEQPYRDRLHAQKMAQLSEDARTAHATPDSQRTNVQRAVVAETAPQLIITPRDLTDTMSEADHRRHKELQGELRKHDAMRPRPLPVAMGIRTDARMPERVAVLERGELSSPAEEVGPGIPAVFRNGAMATANGRGGEWETGRGARSILAQWIANPENPLTARVIVNRLWKHHFGRGLVATPNDFGMRGERPTHPELLDWLATELIRQGWSLKRMHKLMLTSAAYRQRAVCSQTGGKDEKHDVLLCGMRRLRLEAEAVRDSLMAIGGRLNRSVGGPGVFPPIEISGTKGWTVSAESHDHMRRSVYIFARRNMRFPFLEVFDLPDTNLSCPDRWRSTTAPQALAMLNDREVFQCAKTLGQSLEDQTMNTSDRIVRCYRVILGRPPSKDEFEWSREFLKDSSLSELCRALFNVNEFVYLD